MEYTLALDNNSAWLLGTGVANFVSLSGDLFPLGGEVKDRYWHVTPLMRVRRLPYKGMR